MATDAGGTDSTDLPAARPARAWRLGWEPAAFLMLAAYPLFPAFEAGFFGFTGRSLGDQMPTVFIFAVLALGLNVVVGYTGLLHLGIAAFFAIGAYVAGILTAAAYPFQLPFVVALVAGPLVAAGAGLLLGAPTLRLRGDYLALVTLGFGEVTRYTLRNLDEITGGTRGISPVPPPPDLGVLDWNTDYRPFYYLTLAVLVGVSVLLRNLERSRLGRAWGGPPGRRTGRQLHGAEPGQTEAGRVRARLGAGGPGRRAVRDPADQHGRPGRLQFQPLDFHGSAA